MEEEQLLGEFGNVKAALLGSPGMDDEMFEVRQQGNRVTNINLTSPAMKSKCD